MGFFSIVSIFLLRTNNFVAITVRKLSANMSLLVWNEKVCCNKINVMSLMGKSFISVVQKAITDLINKFSIFSQIFLPVTLIAT